MHVLQRISPGKQRIRSIKGEFRSNLPTLSPALRSPGKPFPNDEFSPRVSARKEPVLGTEDNNLILEGIAGLSQTAFHVQHRLNLSRSPLQIQPFLPSIFFRLFPPLETDTILLIEAITEKYSTLQREDSVIWSPIKTMRYKAGKQEGAAIKKCS